MCIDQWNLFRDFFCEMIPDMKKEMMMMSKQDWLMNICAAECLITAKFEKLKISEETAVGKDQYSKHA